jgi:FkbM family methyltransferase
MQYSKVAGILRMIIQDPGYRRHVKDVLSRPKKEELNPNLPARMAAPIEQIAMHLNHTPNGRLENPISVLDFQIGYLGERQLRILIHEIFVEGCYFFRVQRPDPVILDCGSNIGVSIAFFKALYPRSRVIGFEPDPSTFKQLAENVRVNGLVGVEINNVALSEADGNIEFFISAEERGSLLMSAHKERLLMSAHDEERRSGMRITVPSRRLSTFVPDQVDLLKMDIEGSEVSVLCELESSGALARIDQMHLEYHHHISSTRDSMSEVLALLERNGFGYQIQCRSPRWPEPAVFQDVGLFAYKPTQGPRERSIAHLELTEMS